MFWKAQRPDAVLVAQRISVLYFVVQYGLTLMDAAWIDRLFPGDARDPLREDMQDFLGNPMTYLDRQGLRSMLSPQEKAFFSAAPDTLSRDRRISAIYRLNAYGVLTWALKLTDRFSYDDPTRTTGLDVLPNNFARYAQTATLRPPEEIEKARELSLMWHLRTLIQMRIDAKAILPEGLQVHGPMSDEDAIQEVLRMDRTGEIAIIDGDFAALGKAYRDLTHEEWSHVHSITMNRHRALNWLCGHAPGNRWDETPVLK